MKTKRERTTCGACCGNPWAVRFWWSYTTPEYYCVPCLEAPLGPTQPGKTLLDFMPDCQQITWRPDPANTKGLTIESTRELQIMLRSKL